MGGVVKVSTGHYWTNLRDVGGKIGLQDVVQLLQCTVGQML